MVAAIEPEDATARQEDQPPVAHQAGRLIVQEGRDELGVDGQVEIRGQRAEAGRARDRLGQRPLELEQEAPGDVVDPARRVEAQSRADGQQRGHIARGDQQGGRRPARCRRCGARMRPGPS